MNIDEQIKYIKEKHGEQHRGMFTKDRALMRSKTFPGIARAMAEQWTKE